MDGPKSMLCAETHGKLVLRHREKQLPPRRGALGQLANGQPAKRGPRAGLVGDDVPYMEELCGPRWGSTFYGLQMVIAFTKLPVVFSN